MTSPQGRAVLTFVDDNIHKEREIQLLGGTA